MSTNDVRSTNDNEWRHRPMTREAQMTHSQMTAAGAITINDPQILSADTVD